MDGLTKLERAVLEKLLSGTSDTFQILREQLGSRQVADRELTGVGFLPIFRCLTMCPHSLTVRRSILATWPLA
jgi:hypothetical protein